MHDSTPPDFRKAPVALGILGLMVAASASGLLSILEAALLAGGGMLVTRCVPASKARRYVDLSVLVVTDYLRLGAPLSLIVGATAVGLIPLVWPF